MVPKFLRARHADSVVPFLERAGDEIAVDGDAVPRPAVVFARVEERTGLWIVAEEHVFEPRRDVVAQGLRRNAVTLDVAHLPRVVLTLHREDGCANMLR